MGKKKLLDIASNVAGNIAQGAGNMAIGRLDQAIFGKKDRETQLEQQRLLDEQSYAIGARYGEQAAQAAHERSKELIGLTGIGGQIAQAEKAGLSKSVFAAGLGGGGGTAGGAMGPAGSPSAQADSPVDRQMARVQLGMMMNQSALVKAERDKIIAETTNIEKGTEESEQRINQSKVMIDNIIQDTGNKKTIQRLNSLQADYQDIVNSYEEMFKQKEFEKMSAEINYLNEDARRLILSNNITERSKEQLIKNTQLQNANLIAITLKAYSDTEVNEENKKFIQEKTNEIESNIKLLESSTNLNESKKINQDFLNILDAIEVHQTQTTGMREQTGLLAPLVNTIRANTTRLTDEVLWIKGKITGR